MIYNNINNSVIDVWFLSLFQGGKMVKKNCELDQPIIDAVKNEFLEKGFMGTSIRSIANRAGVTPGAIYTRYKGKDDLFLSLIKSFIEAVEGLRHENKESYFNFYNQKELNVEDLIEIINKETTFYIDLIFEYYSECKLLFCRSTGSSIENLLSDMMRYKIDESKKMLSQITSKDFDMDFVEIILNQQMNVYSTIIEKDYSKEKALECLKIYGEYVGAGWAEILKFMTQGVNFEK